MTEIKNDDIEKEEKIDMNEVKHKEFNYHDITFTKIMEEILNKFKIHMCCCVYLFGEFIQNKTHNKIFIAYPISYESFPTIYNSLRNNYIGDDSMFDGILKCMSKIEFK